METRELETLTTCEDDNKINWRQKLSSRKFWALLAELAIAIGAFAGMSDQMAVQVTALIVSFGAVVVYILSEGMVDAARAKAQTPDMVIHSYEEPFDYDMLADSICEVQTQMGNVYSSEQPEH